MHDVCNEAKCTVPRRGLCLRSVGPVKGMNVKRDVWNERLDEETIDAAQKE